MNKTCRHCGLSIWWKSISHWVHEDTGSIYCAGSTTMALPR